MPHKIGHSRIYVYTNIFKVAEMKKEALLLGSAGLRRLYLEGLKYYIEFIILIKFNKLFIIISSSLELGSTEFK
jgi:porphobilinogen deaminase